MAAWHRVCAGLSLLGLLATVACSARGPGDASLLPGETGRLTLALESGSLPGLTSVDYSLRLYYLDVQPPLAYGDATQRSVLAAGDALTVLTCRTGADGTGLNQLQVEARIQLADRSEPVRATASAVFRCLRNADTRVNIILSVGTPADVGWTDVDLHTIGTQCTSHAEFRGDEVLAVCGSSSCNQSDAVLLWVNGCRTLRGVAPELWACGSPADWTLLGTLAEAQFPVPLRDGTFAWQVVALDRLRLAAPDPSLSDASGNLRVFRGVASPAARFVRAGGRNQPVEVQAARTLDFAAELETPDVAGTVPLPHPLLTLRVGTAGTDVSWRVRFGACDTTPQGTSTYPGRFAVDVRLRSPAEALLFLSPTAGGLVTHVASCRAERTAGAVRVVCGEPSPVGGA